MTKTGVTPSDESPMMLGGWIALIRPALDPPLCGSRLIYRPSEDSPSAVLPTCSVWSSSGEVTTTKTEWFVSDWDSHERGHAFTFLCVWERL